MEVSTPSDQRLSDGWSIKITYLGKILTDPWGIVEMLGVLSTITLITFSSFIKNDVISPVNGKWPISCDILKLPLMY